MKKSEFQYLNSTNVTHLAPLSLEASVHVFSASLRALEQDVTPIFVVAHDEQLDSAKALLEFFKPYDREVLVFPNWDCLPYDRVSPSKANVAQRLHVLTSLATGAFKKPCVLTTVQALLQKLPPPSLIQDRFLDLKAGDSLEIERVSNFLQHNGYERQEIVTMQGQYALRGGLLDVFPPGFDHPVRVDFFGDDIDSLKFFDENTQRTEKSVDRVKLVPTTEIFLTKTTTAHFRETYRETFGIEATKDPLYEAVSEGRNFMGQEHWMPCFYPKMVDFFTYSGNAAVFLPSTSAEIAKVYLEQVKDHCQSRLMSQKTFVDEGGGYRPLSPEKLYRSWEEVDQTLQGKAQVFYSPLKETKSLDLGYGNPLDLSSFPRGSERNEALRKHIQGAQKPTLFFGRSRGHVQHLKEVLQEEEMGSLQEINHWSEVGKGTGTYLIQCLIHKGFQTRDFEAFSGEEVLGRSLQSTGKKGRKKVSSLFEVMNFQEGELLVHRDYGIARYKGLQNIQIGGAAHDCIALEYAKEDVLYVPVENMDLLSFYGSGGDDVVLDRLGGGHWELRKARAKKRIQDIAKKLIELAAVRETQTAQGFEADQSLYQEFCKQFPYVETEDQERAIQEVLEDLGQGKPMDRLLCGDVGFGKTEVALRAAYVVAQAGYQVALICPTTILCAQHFQTFKRRFAPFGFRIESLSRAQKASEAKKIREDLKAGNIDIVLGTHALLSKAIGFKKLGLVIVDEEQHFGVKQKEYLKTLVKDVHVLSMSATPIPRSLQMAISGIRQLSVITTPPVDRLAVHTFVSSYDSLVVREAILREFHRGGQSFYVCPRVSDLERVREKLEQLVPEVKVAVGHGGMPPDGLASVMQAFENHEYDVLLATNIIESGLDIPNANTLIVHRSDLFGLSQLYQLRGRVGRSKVRGYAYFTFTPDKQLTDSALKRLEVIQGLEGLGGGFSLASRDMDIRGVGNLVGEAQSGHVKEVGVSLYHHMLETAILACKKEGPQEEVRAWSPQIHLGLEVLIPEAYIRDLNLRLSFYRRLSEIETGDESVDLQEEMVDRFGDLPQEVLNLFKIVHLKNLCKKLFLQKIDVGPKGVLISFVDDKCPYVSTLLDFIGQHGSSVRLRPDHKVVIIKAWKDHQDQLKGLTKILKELNSLRQSQATD